MDENKLSISWFSNAPWYNTGYGNQTRLFVPRLKRAGYDVAITSFAGLEGSVLNWMDGIQVYPRGYHLYGQDMLAACAIHQQTDVTISLMDAWVCEPDMFPDIRWVPWFPIDSHPVTRINSDKVARAYDRLVFSKHGCKMMDDAGLDYSYIPHGVDTNVFKPMDREEARKLTRIPEFTADRFIVGMVAANKGFPSRKAFSENIAAFKVLHDRHPDALLYIHTSDGAHMEGQNLPEYIKFIGLELGKDVILSDQFAYVLGYPEPIMNAFYNAFDVHLLVSKGEGFGIPILEAQACGCPVIVGDWTSMPELCFSGWKVAKEDAEPEYTQYGAYWYVGHPEAIASKLEAAYHKKGDQRMRDKAREGAMAYDADLIVEKYWIPYLEKLTERVRTEKKHTWAKVGLWNKDGTMSVPCVDCNDELINGSKVIEDGFAPVFESGVTLDLVQDTDGITKIVTREIQRDYDLDGLDLKPGDVVLDIGAHKGIVSCYLAKRYPGVKVYAFEPNEANYKAMLENIERNPCDVQPIFGAVTKDGRSVNLYAKDDNSGGGSLQGSGDIPSYTLSDFMAQYAIDRIALLKIDCEGSEFEILENAGDVLDRVDNIRGEFHGGAGDIDALLKMVQAHVPDTKVTMLRVQ